MIINPNRYLFEFVHVVYEHFFKDTLEYFGDYLYPRFEYQVVSTYEKAVEYIRKQSQYGRETDRPQLPALVLNPSGEFLPADTNAGGRQLWRYPNLASGFIKRLFDPIYQDQHVEVNVGFMRVTGEIELIMLLNSFYEYTDVRMLLINMFGGLDRWIFPQWFTSFIIIPTDLLGYKYRNEYTHLSYTPNWRTADGYRTLVRSTNRNEMVVPCRILPQYKLSSLADGSIKYGGDRLASWRLLATLTYEIEIPNYIVLNADYLLEHVDLEMRYGSCYSSYSNYQPPTDRMLYDVDWDFGLDSTSNSEISTDTTAVISYYGYLTFRTRYFHVATKAEAASTTNIIIDIPETVETNEIVIVNSKYGALSYGDHYIIKPNRRQIEIKVANVKLKAGMIIELFIYRKSGPYVPPDRNLMAILQENGDYIFMENNKLIYMEQNA